LLYCDAAALTVRAGGRQTQHRNSSVCGAWGRCWRALNATVPASNGSHLAWCRNPTWQNNCSPANTTFQWAWNTKKIPGEMKSSLWLSS